MLEKKEKADTLKREHILSPTIFLPRIIPFLLSVPFSRNIEPNDILKLNKPRI
jgi:hypothetical protein